MNNSANEKNLFKKYVKHGYIVVKNFNGYEYFYGRHGNFTLNTNTFEWNGIKIFLHLSRAEKIAKEFKGNIIKFSDKFKFTE